ncbi:hypothetical protein A3K73_05925 [Candidatus Pacearchaeota archaeon RBG_13_36_9]|nr:MAG: hypothetical protein A3K73_05925 [Candidatus Pacearchaeota archaeon RBG_13_36_9]
MEKEQKTIQLGLRIEKEQLEKIEALAGFEKIDKMAWIRRAIADSIGDVEDQMEDAAIEDYIWARIDEKRLKEATRMNSIPEDLKKAREDTLKGIIKGRNK